jgi:hypothetical protein
MTLSHRTEGVTYKCKGRGALLSLPRGGTNKDVIRTKAFEDYIRDHVVSWYTWAQNNKLGVGKMEDLILVSGCTMVTSWAAATFVDSIMDAKISLASRLDKGETSFVWSNKQGPVMFHDGQFNPVRSPDHVYSTYTDFFFVCIEREKNHKRLRMRPMPPRLRINVSSSRASEQKSALSSGSNTSVPLQDPVQTTLTIAETMIYK